MKKILLLVSLFFVGLGVKAQVGIGTATPNQSAELEIVSTNRGLLIPRIQLQSTTDQQTIVGGNVESLLIYNTATQNDVTPGYYYWHNGKWRKIMNTGNSIITTLTDNTDGTFTYVNEAGDTTNFDANTLTFINNNDGSYTFVKANGDSLVVDVPGEVVNNFGDIVNNGPVLVDGNTYTTVKKYLQSIVDSSQTVTTLVDNGNGTFAYINEAGDTTNFDANTTNFVNNNDGTYTLTTDGGDTLTIDVPGSVVQNFDTIVNGGPVTVDGNTYTTVKKYLNSLIDSSATVIQYDSTNNTMTVVNQAGDTTTVQFNNTQFVNHNDGTYTYINEQGDTTLVNVPGDIVKNITNKGDVYNVIDSLISSSSDTLYDNGNGTYTHIAVNGDTTVINVPGSVVKNFDTIVNGGPVTVDGDTYATVKKYLAYLADSSETLTSLTYNDTTNVLTYTDEKNMAHKIQLGQNITNTVVYNGDTIAGNPVAIYKTTTTIGVHTALTSGVNLPVAPNGVVSIALYQSGILRTNSVTDVQITGNSVGFSIGVGSLYEVMPQGTYDVIIKFTTAP